MKLALLSLLIAAPAAGAGGRARRSARARVGSRQRRRPRRARRPPTVVVPVVAVPRDWRGVFAAIRTGHWAEAQAGHRRAPRRPAQARRQGRALSPPRDRRGSNWRRCSRCSLRRPTCPRPTSSQRMAVARGAIEPPRIAYARPIVFLGSAPRRQRARPSPAIRSPTSSAPASIRWSRSTMPPRMPSSRSSPIGPFLSPEARAEAAQRVAWIYYVAAATSTPAGSPTRGRAGARGEWGGQAAWISGLAAWRMGDCTALGRGLRRHDAHDRATANSPPPRLIGRRARRRPAGARARSNR